VKYWIAGLILFTGCWTVAFAGSHKSSNVQFSGRTVQSAPDGRTRKAKLFVGDNKVRLEYRKGGLEIVEIYDMENQRLLLLVPEQKIYMQRDFPPGQVVNPILPPGESNPCSVMPEGKCKKLGDETMYGRPVSHWEVTLKRQGTTLHSLHWIDDERLMSLRDVWPDGSISEMKLLGIEDIDGEKTERWQRTTVHPDGKKEVAVQWYDPLLGIAVREELPGGYVREIRDIRVGKQPEALFQVPDGYRQVDSNRQE